MRIAPRMLVILLPCFASTTVLAQTDPEPSAPPQPDPVPAPPIVMAPPPRPSPPPVVAAPPPPEVPWTAAIGFALELGLETALFSTTTTAGQLNQPTVFVGYHESSLTVGVTLALDRLDQSTSESTNGTTSSNDTSTTNIVIMPGLRATLARTDDRRTELFGQVDLGYGFVLTGSDATPTPPPPPPTSNSTSTHSYLGQLGLGVRRWLAPSFAIGAVGGLRYERDTTDTTVTSGTTTGDDSSSVSVTSMFGTIQITAVF